MYYVIKKQPDSPSQCFIGFKVPKYIASKGNENIIFEFKKDGKVIRKWVKFNEIVLLTDDKTFFEKTIAKFREVAAEQQKLVDDAHKHLEKSMQTYTETVNEELHEFEKIRGSDDIPCILKDMY